MSVRWRQWAEAPRLAPLLGVAIGTVGGAVYWLGAQIWPTSVAVVLSMLATALLGARTAEGEGAKTQGAGLAGFVFAVLIKYNVLMALSAANLPFALPANLSLGFIMIAGHASSRTLVVTVLPPPSHPASTPPSHADLVIALLLGFAPAALIGIPGLIGLAAAIVARIAFVAYLRRRRPAISAAILDMTKLMTEVCFYLGALATWAYV
jgi:cobalamin synthase